MNVRGEHEIYCCGSRVRISEKGVEVLSEPLVEYCPLHEALYGTKEIDTKAVQESVEMKISGFGLCCGNRKFDVAPVVAYGASEMMRVWLERRLVDCAVVVAEGAGTVITPNGELVQGIGARLTGVIRTSPIPDIIGHVEANGGHVLDPQRAVIDQLEGVRRACDLGFKRVAVSVAGFRAEKISKIRDFSRETGLDVLAFSVCNTCVMKDDLKHVVRADVVCASASKVVREEIGKRALLQLGVTIPVYALSDRGKRLVLAYLNEFEDKLVIFRTGRMPYHVESRGPKLKD